MDYSQNIRHVISAKNIKIIREEKDCLKVRIKRGSKKKFSIPLKITPELAYLVACIICDGHIRKDKYKIYFETVKEETTKKFTEIFNYVFETNEKYKIRIERRENRQKPYRLSVNGKPVVLLFEKIFDIPRGKKSHLVYVPKGIMENSYDIQSAFLEGVFETDGGKRGKQLGLTSASKRFRDDTCKLINKFNIKVTKDEWINKITKKRYYGLRFAGVPKPPFSVLKGKSVDGKRVWKVKGARSLNS